MNPEIVPDVAGNDDRYTQINMPYRLAMQIQEHVVQEASMTDYTLGIAEREDIAFYYVSEHLSRWVDPESLAWDGLQHWYRIYGKGLHER
jgi:hypothetical protein